MACIWVALWGAGTVRRYAPNGRVDREYVLPVSQVTSVAFRNRDASTRFITAAATGPDSLDEAHERLGGSI
jgi:sugar lactone lactonase YvrE